MNANPDAWATGNPKSLYETLGSRMFFKNVNNFTCVYIHLKLRENCRKKKKHTFIYKLHYKYLSLLKVCD